MEERIQMLIEEELTVKNKRYKKVNQGLKERIFHSHSKSPFNIWVT